MMLRAALICPDQDLGDRLLTAFETLRQLTFVRRVDHYPTRGDMSRMLHASAPELVFLSMESRDLALQLAAHVAEELPGIQFVAINHSCDSSILLETMRAGLREFLSPPFEEKQLTETLDRLRVIIEAQPPAIEVADSVFSFLPAKPGSGASTVAVNTSLALASMANSKVLLGDLDLNGGQVAFSLLMQPQFSILDAAENAFDLDEHLWSKLISKSGGLDVLPTGPLRPGYRIEPAQVKQILLFARRLYSAVCIDLSGMLEKFSIEVMHESKRIFLVCTPELPSLHLAREKVNYLRTQELHGKVSILLNRAQKRHQITIEEMEKIFGLPIHMTLPNDYVGVHKALTAGKPVHPASPLGAKFRQLAETMVTSPTTGSPETGASKFMNLLFGRKLETA